jgi:ATP-dependent DNA ligase
VCERLLNGRSRSTIPLVDVVFDVLERDATSTMRLPLRERRGLLDDLGLHGRHWQTSALFDDGEALFSVAQERGLEGVVAKPVRAPTGPVSAAGRRLRIAATGGGRLSARARSELERTRRDSSASCPDSISQ